MILPTLSKRAKQKGQGVIEYAGAMIIAALVVATLCTGMGSNNWMYNAYDTIFNAAGNMLVSQLGGL